MLGRGVRLAVAPHLAAAVAAQPPREVIPCGTLTQVEVETLGMVCAPAVLGQESDGVFRPNAGEGKKGRFFVPAGVAVDGTKMRKSTRSLSLLVFSRSFLTHYLRLQRAF